MAKDIFLYVFSVFIVSCAVGVVVVLAFFPIPEANRDAFMQSSGALITWGAATVGYWIGSSVGSAKKTDLLAKANPIT